MNNQLSIFIYILISKLKIYAIATKNCLKKYLISSFVSFALDRRVEGSKKPMTNNLSKWGCVRNWHLIRSEVERRGGEWKFEKGAERGETRGREGSENRLWITFSEWFCQSE